MVKDGWLTGDAHFGSTYIAGGWHASRGDELMRVIDPCTGATAATVQESSESDVGLAVTAAADALAELQSLRAAERAHLLRALAVQLEARADRLADAVTTEMGMPVKYCSEYQVHSAITVLRSTADVLDSVPFESIVGRSRVRHEPVGVVGAIVPWNYPLLQTASKIGPALAAGCSVVLKPSEQAPLDSLILAEAVDAAGLPAGAINMVFGTGHQIGEALVRHPTVAMVSLTGSTRAGRRVAKVASASIKRVALELGGKSPAIVLDDADLPKAVAHTVASVAMNTGQTCTALTRLLVPMSRLAETEDLVRHAMASYRVGLSSDPTVDLGPVANTRQHEQVRAHQERALLDGARLIYSTPDTALPDQGMFVPLQAFTVNDPTIALAQEEVFGPVLAVIPYVSESDCLKIANGTMYGLAASVWSTDPGRGLNIAAKVDAGVVALNDAPFDETAPFGGFKQSGIGRELGAHGILEFTESKSVFTHPDGCGA